PCPSAWATRIASTYPSNLLLPNTRYSGTARNGNVISDTAQAIDPCGVRAVHTAWAAHASPQMKSSVMRIGMKYCRDMVEKEVWGKANMLLKWNQLSRQKKLQPHFRSSGLILKDLAAYIGAALIARMPFWSHGRKSLLDAYEPLLDVGQSQAAD